MDQQIINTISNTTTSKNSLLVSAILDIGEMLLISGAEVSRVEDTMERIGKAYGFRRVDIFSITSSMVFTVHTEDDEIITQTRRIKSNMVNMEKLEKINALSREICLNPITIEDLQERVKNYSSVKEYQGLTNLFIYALISSSFTMFFGGSINDALASMVTGIFLYWGVLMGNRLHIQKIVLNMICSFTTGLLAVSLIQIGIGDSFEKIIIGNIMLLIPGISLTTSLRDMIKGDVISGLLGLCEALLKAFAIAAGFAFVMIIKGV